MFPFWRNWRARFWKWCWWGATRL